MRYRVECWVDPGVQMDEAETDDRAEALRIREAFQATYAGRKPAVVIYDDELEGGQLGEDDEGQP